MIDESLFHIANRFIIGNVAFILMSLQVSNVLKFFIKLMA